MFRFQRLRIPSKLLEITDGLQLPLPLPRRFPIVFSRPTKTVGAMRRAGIGLGNLLSGDIILLCKPANDGAATNLAAQRRREVLMDCARINPMAIRSETLESFQNVGILFLSRLAPA